MSWLFSATVFYSLFRENFMFRKIKALEKKIIELETSSNLNKELVNRYKERLLEYQLRIRDLENKLKSSSSNKHQL